MTERISKRLIGATLLCCLAFTCAGCGTIVGTVDGINYDYLSPVYAGVRLDYNVITGNVCCIVPKILVPFAIIDLPISAVADTLILPVTLIIDHNKKTSKPKEDAQHSGDKKKADDQNSMK